MLRQTIRKRLQAKLSEVKAELKRRMHEPVPEVGKWLRAVVEGHNRYWWSPSGARSWDSWSVMPFTWHTCSYGFFPEGSILRLIHSWHPRWHEKD